MVSYTTDRLAEWVNDIVPYYANMYLEYARANYWPPNFASCDLCSFKPICEVDRGTREDVKRVEFVKGNVWDVTNDD